MFNKINPNIKIGVLSSLIATVFFLYFLEPIISFLSNIFLNVGSWLFQSYIDRIYQEIAVGQMDYTFLFAMIMFFIIANLSLVFAIRLLIRREIKNKETAAISKPRQRNVVIGILLLAATITSSFLLVTGYIKKRTFTSFEQHLRIVNPYITNDTKIKIISDFSSMESRKDYEKIVAYLNMVATKNNIKLPENRLHPF